MVLLYIYRYYYIVQLSIPIGRMQCSVMSLLTSDREGIGSIFSAFLSVDVGSRGI